MILTMEEIIKDLEHTIKYFEDAQNDFQRGRVFQAKKILEALRARATRLYLVVEVIDTHPILHGAEYTTDRAHAEAVRDAMPAREGVAYVVVGIDPIGSSEAANELITQNTQPNEL